MLGGMSVSWEDEPEGRPRVEVLLAPSAATVRPGIDTRGTKIPLGERGRAGETLTFASNGTLWQARAAAHRPRFGYVHLR